MPAPPAWPWSPESLFEAMFEKAPIVLCVVDRERRYMRINEAGAVANGLPVEAHIGHRMRDVVPQIAATVEPLIEQVLATGQPIASIEVRTEDPREPGAEVWFLGSGYPVLSESGELVGVGIVAVDITARK